MSRRVVLVVWVGAQCIAANAAEIDAFECPLDVQDSCRSECIISPPFLENYTVRPGECEEFLWCAFVKTDLKELSAGRAAICQRQKYFVGAPLFERQGLAVDGGTLDLSELSSRDTLGRIELEIPDQGFRLTFLVEVTEVLPPQGEVTRADFEVRVDEVNQNTIDILGYDPKDEFHSSGRLYEGTVFARGPGEGFELFYELIRTPPPGFSRAIEEEELLSHGNNLPALFSWFDSESAVFTLPPEGLVTARATIEQFLDPLIFLQFVDTVSIDDGATLDLEGEARFRRGDPNGDERVDLSDVVYLLEYLFLGRATPGCPDAADADDDGVLSVTDALAIISSLFGAGVAPGFDLGVCAADATADQLAPCVSDC